MQTHMVIRHANCLMPFGYVCSIGGNEYMNNQTSPDSITQEMHVWICQQYSTTTTTTILAGARRKLLLDFMVLGRITRGRHMDNPGGRHSIRTNQQSTSINPPSLCQLPFLPQPSQFILAWDRHRSMLDCIQYPVAWFSQQYSAMSKTVTEIN